ncbi:MAG: hypothetical protein JNM34_09335 [Chthonomonadaceae bacterium]|nr:hypothetical protein [Chthonomonadaceae bacterium]
MKDHKSLVIGGIVGAIIAAILFLIARKGVVTTFSIPTTNWQFGYAGGLVGKVTVHNTATDTDKTLVENTAVSLGVDDELTLAGTSPVGLILNLPDSGWIFIAPGSKIKIYNDSGLCVQFLNGTSNYFRHDELPDHYSSSSAKPMAAVPRKFKTRNVSTVVEGTDIVFKTSDQSPYLAVVGVIEGKADISITGYAKTVNAGFKLSWSNDAPSGEPVAFP